MRDSVCDSQVLVNVQKWFNNNRAGIPVVTAIFSRANSLNCTWQVQTSIKRVGYDLAYTQPSGPVSFFFSVFGYDAFQSPYLCPRPLRVVLLGVFLFRAPAHLFNNGESTVESVSAGRCKGLRERDGSKRRCQ